MKNSSWEIAGNYVAFGSIIEGWAEYHKLPKFTIYVEGKK